MSRRLDLYCRRLALGVVDLEGPLAEQVAIMDAACRELGFFQLPVVS